MKTRVYNLIILDESGSMKTIRRGTVACIDNLVDSIRMESVASPLLEQHVSCFSFNSEGVREQIALTKADPGGPRFDWERYRPSGLTPLYDAIGHATGRLRVQIGHDDGYAVLVTILTDGAENASQVYDSRSVSGIVRQLQSHDWVFTYIGTNHDVAADAARIGIRNARTFDYGDTDPVRFMDDELEHRRRYYRSLLTDEHRARRDRYFEKAG